MNMQNSLAKPYAGMLALLKWLTFALQSPRVPSADFRRAPAAYPSSVQCPIYLGRTERSFGRRRTCLMPRCSAKIYATTGPGSTTATSSDTLRTTIGIKHRITVALPDKVHRLT